MENSLVIGSPDTELKKFKSGFLKSGMSLISKHFGQEAKSSMLNFMRCQPKQPYTAAFIAKTVMEVKDLVQGYSYWTFSDIFEENYFSSVHFAQSNVHAIFLHDQSVKAMRPISDTVLRDCITPFLGLK